MWTFQAVYESLRRRGTQRIIQKVCPLSLYSTGHGKCNVLQSSFEVSGTLTGVSGLQLTATEFSSKADGWFTGGKITINNAVRHISSHAGNVIEITNRIIGLESGLAFVAMAGCPHTIDVCESRFANSINFGGCTHLNSKNPFAGDGLL
jgi:uncharacterized phage protein (TIGR02218 family)